jgi:hypothetical protein
MRRQSLLRILATAVSTAFSVLMWRWRPSDAVAAQTSMGDMMGGGMMSPSNMNGPMRTGMELFQRHGQVRRTVSEVPGGVHAVSESDDPYTASLLQEHVSEMYARLDQGRDFPYPMSRSVPAMFANSTRYHRKLTMLPKGIAVTETSNDARIVEIIRAHAREINGFVKDGMPAMMRNMMQ